MAQYVIAANQSSILLPAREVLRLAIKSIADIDAERNKLVTQILPLLEEQRCKHFLGIVSHARYPTREDALEHAPEIQAAKQMGRGDRNTCELLMKAAQYLIDAKNLSDDQRVVRVTLNDFRALI